MSTRRSPSPKRSLQERAFTVLNQVHAYANLIFGRKELGIPRGRYREIDWVRKFRSKDSALANFESKPRGIPFTKMLQRIVPYVLCGMEDDEIEKMLKLKAGRVRELRDEHQHEWRDAIHEMRNRVFDHLSNSRALMLARVLVSCQNAIEIVEAHMEGREWQGKQVNREMGNQAMNVLKLFKDLADEATLASKEFHDLPEMDEHEMDMEEQANVVQMDEVIAKAKKTAAAASKPGG